MLLAVVNILLKIKNVVSSEEIAAIGALYNPRRRCGRSCRALAAAYDKRRRRRSRLRGIGNWETKFERAKVLPVSSLVSYHGLFPSPLESS